MLARATSVSRHLTRKSAPGPGPARLGAWTLSIKKTSRTLSIKLTRRRLRAPAPATCARVLDLTTCTALGSPHYSPRRRRRRRMPLKKRTRQLQASHAIGHVRTPPGPGSAGRMRAETPHGPSPSKRLHVNLSIKPHQEAITRPAPGHACARSKPNHVHWFRLAPSPTTTAACSQEASRTHARARHKRLTPFDTKERPGARPGRQSALANSPPPPPPSRCLLPQRRPDSVRLKKKKTALKEKP